MNREQAWKAYTILHSDGPIYSDEMDDNAKCDFMSGYDVGKLDKYAAIREALATRHWEAKERYARSLDKSSEAQAFARGELNAIRNMITLLESVL